jgi:hypothetical protein
MDTLNEHQYTFFIISRQVQLRMKNVTKICGENQSTVYVQNRFSRNSCRLCVIVKNAVELDRPQMAHVYYMLNT